MAAPHVPNGPATSAPSPRAAEDDPLAALSSTKSTSSSPKPRVSGPPLFATTPLYRGWHLRRGAADDEVGGPMPGADNVPKASLNASRAMTIDASPESVWPVVRADGLPGSSIRRTIAACTRALDRSKLGFAERMVR
jgi:hypothetical protein